MDTNTTTAQIWHEAENLGSATSSSAVLGVQPTWLSGARHWERRPEGDLRRRAPL